MTRFTVGCVMDVLGNKPLVLVILLYIFLNPDSILNSIFYFRVAGGNTNIYMFIIINLSKCGNIWETK